MAASNTNGVTETTVDNETEKKASTDEDLLFEAVRSGNVLEVSRLSSLWNIKIDETDQSGMTPLMHAAYKGDAESVEVLLTHGAEVNRKSTEHEYTPLMFATLAGSKQSAKILLEAGADPSAENKIHKTATQMGAFVGRHECVSLINNYVGKEDIEYYTKPQGFESEPKLSPFLAEPLQNYIISTNLHTVHLLLYLDENIALVESSKQVARVLEIKRDRLFKRDINEVMSMKLHYLYRVHEACVKWHKSEDGIHGLIRKLLRGRLTDGFPLAMEDFIRDSIRSFPFRESTLFKHLVRILAPVEKGNEPTALSVITQSINGLQSANFTNACFTCNRRESTKKCANCKMARYCSQDCQRMHWFSHKKSCKNLVIQYERELKIQREFERQQKEAEAKKIIEREVKEELQPHNVGNDDDKIRTSNAKEDEKKNMES